MYAAIRLDDDTSAPAVVEIFPPYRRFMLEQFIPAVELDGDALSVEEFELWMGKLFARLERYFGLFDVLERTMPWR